MTEPRGDLGEAITLALEVIAENLHLYAVSVGYWVLIAAFLGLRYALGRRSASDRLRVPIVAWGVLAVAVAITDVVARGDASVTHVSLVAYLATPLGIGRYVVARWDGHEAATLAALRMRLTTYATAFVAFVVLAALDGNPWTPTRPHVDRSSVEAIIHHTEWMPFMATVFGLLLVLDTVSSLASAGWGRLRSGVIRGGAASKGRSQ